MQVIDGKGLSVTKRGGDRPVTDGDTPTHAMRYIPARTHDGDIPARPGATPATAYDAALRRLFGAMRDRRQLERADVLALLYGQPDDLARDRAALALARADLLGVDCGLRELFAAGSTA